MSTVCDVISSSNALIVSTDGSTMPSPSVMREPRWVAFDSAPLDGLAIGAHLDAQPGGQRVAAVAATCTGSTRWVRRSRPWSAGGERVLACGAEAVPGCPERQGSKDEQISGRRPRCSRTAVRPVPGRPPCSAGTAALAVARTGEPRTPDSGDQPGGPRSPARRGHAVSDSSWGHERAAGIAGATSLTCALSVWVPPCQDGRGFGASRVQVAPTRAGYRPALARSPRYDG